LGCGILLVGLFLAPILRAQAVLPRLAAPRIGYVYPAGGQVGTTFTVTVGGEYLADTAEAEWSGAGITAKILGLQRPLSGKEAQELREEAEKLRGKRQASRANAPVAAANAEPKPVWTPEDEKRAQELRLKLAYNLNRQTAPAISEAVTLEVSVAADTARGVREVRLRTPNGLSNPLVFQVGQLPEFTEPAAPPNTAPAENRNPDAARPRKTGAERMISLPAIVNGQILPGEVDRIRFAAKAGQKLTMAVNARALIPYLADAVPGWFQATLALFDEKGHELAYDGSYRFNPDPVLFYEIRTDGDYVIEIKDSLYRGRQDFVYRIAVGELPFITDLYPLGGRVGKQTEVQVNGWNLPDPRAVMDGQGRPPGHLDLAVRKENMRSNSVPFALDTEPEFAETEPNNDEAHAQQLALPAIVNGRIGQPGDRDVFTFEGRAGNEVVIEVVARRLNSPLDSILQLTNVAGKPIAANDDSEDKGFGLETHHADSRIAVKLPVDGRYFIHLGDAQHQGGAEFAYRLHVGPPRPDFELRVVPSTLNLRMGTHVPVTVFALRKDGFAGPIELGLRDAVHRFGLSGARIPAGQDKVRLTVTTAAPPRDEAFALDLVGQGTIDGRSVTRLAVPAEDMMQAFIYRHLVPMQELKVQVIGGGRIQPSAFRLLDRTPLRIAAGGTAHFRVAVGLGRAFEHFKIELSEPPDGISLQSSAGEPNSVELVIAADAAKVKPGQQGNLILMVSAERTGAAEKKAENPKAQNRARIPLSALPALPFEIVGK